MGGFFESVIWPKIFETQVCTGMSAQAGPWRRKSAHLDWHSLPISPDLQNPPMPPMPPIGFLR